MKKTLAILLLLLLTSVRYSTASIQYGTVTDDRNTQLSIKLDSLSAINLIYSSSKPEDGLSSICSELEQVARDAQDLDEMFRIAQISVNLSCLNGDIGLGINKAQKMYDEAKKLNHNLGLALAIQAIGNTYMHSGQDAQAENLFIKSQEYMASSNDTLSKIRLAIQLLHVNINLNHTEDCDLYLNIVNELLKSESINRRYAFYLDYYEALHDIKTKDKATAQKSINEFLDRKNVKREHPRWFHELSYHNARLLEEHAEALLFHDSVLNTIREIGNVNEYRARMMDKALTLRSAEKLKEACLLYEEISFLSDSINTKSYISQIDSLHATYWIDEIALENASAHNSLLIQMWVSSLIILIIIVIIICIIRLRNKRLILSQKRLEERKKEASESIQSKAIFLSNMSHELRTPLNAIVGFSDILASEDMDDYELQQQSCNLIRQNSDLLLKLLDDVVCISGLKGDTIKFTYAQTDIIALCKGVINTVNGIKTTSIQLQFLTPLKEFKFDTDSGRLQQVLINLLINSTKFTASGTIKLILDIDREKNEAVFAVEDTGVGIPLEKHPYIFERFEKLHEGVQGAGLGLSICQLIVTHIGGRIWIDSTYTIGARFVFTHPLKNNIDNNTL